MAAFHRLEAPFYALHDAAAALFGRFRRRGRTTSTVDTLIVQMAADYRIALLTRDRLQAELARLAGVRLA